MLASLRSMLVIEAPEVADRRHAVGSLLVPVS
jgi:hypothetical protein